MSTTLTPMIGPAVAQGPGTFSKFFRASWDKIAHYFIHRAAIAHLRELDDHALCDIGLARPQIEAAVRGSMGAPWN
ncbi:MAG TPA: DUF1127 domain-containing protein [Alphaproteobacteria bacterium]|nr:DUF1127 domain-containing protein [Alphaproteobacteria bacterium]